MHVNGDLSGSLATLPLPLVADNFIGTSQDGTSVYDSSGNRLGNSKSGILLEESSSNSTGSNLNVLAISGNIISGNGLSGITTQQDSQASSPSHFVNTIISDNIIGLDVNGATAGVYVKGRFCLLATFSMAC